MTELNPAFLGSQHIVNEGLISLEDLGNREFIKRTEAYTLIPEFAATGVGGQRKYPLASLTILTRDKAKDMHAAQVDLSSIPERISSTANTAREEYRKGLAAVAELINVIKTNAMKIAATALTPITSEDTASPNYGDLTKYATEHHLETITTPFILFSNSSETWATQANALRGPNGVTGLYNGRSGLDAAMFTALHRETTGSELSRSPMEQMVQQEQRVLHGFKLSSDVETRKSIATQQEVVDILIALQSIGIKPGSRVQLDYDYNDGKTKPIFQVGTIVDFHTCPSEHEREQLLIMPIEKSTDPTRSIEDHVELIPGNGHDSIAIKKLSENSVQIVRNGVRTAAYNYNITITKLAA